MQDADPTLGTTPNRRIAVTSLIDANLLVNCAD